MAQKQSGENRRIGILRILSFFYLLPLAALTVALAVLSACKSVYFALYEQNEIPSYKSDRPLLLLAMLVLAVAAGRWMHKRIVKKEKEASGEKGASGECSHVQNGMPGGHGPGEKYRLMPMALTGDCPPLLAAALLAAGTISLLFLFMLRPQPFADSIAVSQFAGQFLHGDFSMLQFPNAAGDDYLVVYPFQIGFIAFLQLIYFFFGDGNYLALQLINAIAILFMVRNLYELTGEVFGSRETQTYFLWMSVGMLPLYLHVGYVYGDLCGWSLATGSFLLLFRYLRDHRKRHILWAGILLAAAIQIKSNEQIFLVAFVMILAATAFVRKKFSPLLLAVYMTAAAMLLGAVVEAGYTRAAGLSEFPKGAPKSSWVAMAMLEDEYAEFGWYNGYNRNNFTEHDYDYEAADQAAKESIRESLTNFLEHPAHAAYLYYKKFESSWNDPSFQSQITIEWESRHTEGLSTAAESILYGTGRQILYWIMNVVHFIIITLAGWRMILSFRKEEREKQWKMAAYLLPVFGGLLFHMLWETQCRYLIVYYCMLFPVAADGMRMLQESLGRKTGAWHKDREKDNSRAQ